MTTSTDNHSTKIIKAQVNLQNSDGLSNLYCHNYIVNYFLPQFCQVPAEEKQVPQWARV